MTHLKRRIRDKTMIWCYPMNYKDSGPFHLLQTNATTRVQATTCEDGIGSLNHSLHLSLSLSLYSVALISKIMRTVSMMDSSCGCSLYSNMMQFECNLQLCKWQGSSSKKRRSSGVFGAKLDQPGGIWRLFHAVALISGGCLHLKAEPGLMKPWIPSIELQDLANKVNHCKCEYLVSKTNSGSMEYWWLLHFPVRSNFPD